MDGTSQNGSPLAGTHTEVLGHIQPVFHRFKWGKKKNKQKGQCFFYQKSSRSKPRCGAVRDQQWVCSPGVCSGPEAREQLGGDVPGVLSPHVGKEGACKLVSTWADAFTDTTPSIFTAVYWALWDTWACYLHTCVLFLLKTGEHVIENTDI